MSYLLLILHLFIGATLAGVGLIVVLVADLATPLTLAGAVLAGMILGFPIARAVERAMTGGGSS